MSSHQHHQQQHNKKKRTAASQGWNNYSSRSGNRSDISAHVVHVEESDPSKNPIVCSFPGGLPEALLRKSTTVATEAASITAEPPTFQWHGDKVVGKDKACIYSSSTTATTTTATTATTSKLPQPEEPLFLSTRLCVGVYDKRTGELTLHPAAGNGRVFSLQQHVIHYHPRNDNNNNNNDNNNNSALLKGATAQYQALFDDFGSAKKRKVLKSQQANRVTDAVGTGVTGNLMSESNRRAVMAQKAAVAAAAAAATAAGEEGAKKSSSSTTVVPQSAEAGVDQAMEAMRLRFLPKYNPHAKHAADVYSAQDMVGDAGWSWLHRQVQSAWHAAAADENGEGNVVSVLLAAYQTNTGNDDTTTTTATTTDTVRDPWHPSVKHVLQNASKVDCRTLDKPAQKLLQQKLQCAVLLNEWMTLYLRLRWKKKGATIPLPDESRARYFGVPMVLALKFLERFATSTIHPENGEAGYVLSQAQSDSCVVHLLLLFLMAEYHNGGNNKNATALRSRNVQPLADDLRLVAADAAKLLRQAGCTVSHKKGNSATTTTVLEAVLKTPLTFPKGRRATAGGGTARR